MEENPKNEKQEEIINADNVLIVGTKNAEILKLISDVSETHSQHLVILDEKVVDDYLKRSEQAVKEPSQQLKDFLENEANRNSAEEKALTLWNIMTKNAELSLSEKRIFTTSEIVQRTNLSHSQLQQALDVFKLFGLIEFTKGRYEFKFIFGKETRAASILADLSETINLAIAQKECYITSLKNLNKTEEAIQTDIDKINSDIMRMLNLG